MTKSVFPKQIYVGLDVSDGNEFLVAAKDYEGLAVQDDKRQIAVYQLLRVANLVNKSEVV